VDQAIEYPLPDAECRRRLIELYGEGLTLEEADLEGLVARTEGASPAFIQEMMRKAALLAAEEGERGGELIVTGRHLRAAIRELLFGGGDLTRNLLGFAGEKG
jgi:ATP-dependent 26S proteasome regulatory subunit